MKVYMQNFIILLALAASSTLYGQKTLELKEAVLEGRKTLAPKKLSNLKWIKGSDSYSYTVKKGKQEFLMKGNKDREDTLLSLKDLNQSINQPDSLALKSMPSVRWVAEGSFIFFHQHKVYQYLLNKKNSTVVLEYDTKAGHLDLEKKNLHLAYVKDNNVYVTTNDGKNAQITYDSLPGIVNGQAVHRYEFGISKGIFWSSKGTHIAFYHKDEQMVTDYPLVKVNTTPAKLKMIKYPMAGGVSHHVKVGIYDLRSGKTIFLKTGEPLEQYLTNICWGPNDKYIYVAILNRGQDHMQLNQYDGTTGEFVKTLFEEKNDKYVHPTHPMYFIEGREGEFIWFSQRDGFEQLFLYNTDGKLIKKLTKDQWVVKSILGLNKEKTKLIITGTGTNPTETHIFSIDLATSNMEQLTKTAGYHYGQLNSESNYILDSYSSLKIPRVIQIIDIEGRQVKELLKAEDPLKEYNIGTTSLFTIDAEDGTPMYCRMIKPNDFNKKKKYPVLVYVYGGPNVQLLTNSWLARAPLWMHYMANKGYIIFTCESRGSYNRGLEFEQLTFRNLGTLELQDQLTGVNYLHSLSFVDTSRMAVHGWSYGGFMTTGLMLRTPGTFKVGVAGGPVIDWRFYEVMYTERYMDTPEENPEGYDKANLMNYVKQLKGDLLMIHGTVDDVVVWQHSLAFVKKCVDEGVQLDYFMYPGHPHNVRGKDRVHLMRKVLDYIEDHLK